MSNLEMNISYFVTEQVQEGAFQMEKKEEYKEINDEYKIYLEKLKSDLAEDKKEILEKMIELINAREFVAREQSYKQGLKEAKLIFDGLFK
ncbi:MAG: hypothetical protein ACOWWH_12190 [Eubacteriaceae bacterium]